MPTTKDSFQNENELPPVFYALLSERHTKHHMIKTNGDSHPEAHAASILLCVAAMSGERGNLQWAGKQLDVYTRGTANRNRARRRIFERQKLLKPRHA
jgi:hypothetical protein